MGFGHFKFLVIAVLTMAVGGCLTVPTQPVDLTYTAAFDKYKGDGPGIVEGQAFLRQQGGGVVTCAGEPVLLIPDEGGFGQALDLVKKGIRPVPPAGGRVSDFAATDPRYQDVVRKAQCDAQGNFAIDKVPTGSWIIFSRVSWIVADVPQGSQLGKRLSVTAAPIRVLLTDTDRI